MWGEWGEKSERNVCAHVGRASVAVTSCKRPPSMSSRTYFTAILHLTLSRIRLLFLLALLLRMCMFACNDKEHRKAKETFLAFPRDVKPARERERDTPSTSNQTNKTHLFVLYLVPRRKLHEENHNFIACMNVIESRFAVRFIRVLCLFTEWALFSSTSNYS